MDIKQTPEKSPPPQKWLKLFLGVNLFVLCSFLVWELTAPVFKTEEEMRIVEEAQEVVVKRTIDKNPEVKDHTGTLGPEIEITIDATVQDQWAHFSFATGKVFYKEKIDKNSLEWDIAFRRAKVVTNGGATNENGKAETAAIKTDDFLSVTHVPDIKFQPDMTTPNIAETKSPVLTAWYKYDWWTHRLTPQNEVYVVRTAKGDYVKFQILNYYCEHIAGCFTIKYVYQGSGSRSFTG